MKKLLKTAFVALGASLAALPLFACESKLIERENYMTITEVTQHADGSVYATLDFGDTDFSAGNYYDLQFSIDGGSSWFRYNSIQIVDNTVNSVPVIVYNPDWDRYVHTTGIYDESSYVNVNPGDTLEITMRISSNDKYAPTKQCNTVEYTLKELSPAGARLPKVDGVSRWYQQDSNGGKTSDYAFERQPDTSFKLVRMIYDPERPEEEMHIIHADLLPEDAGLFEYKFYSFTAEEKENYDYNVHIGEEENRAETTGWTDYAESIGLPYELCNARASTVFFLNKWSDMDGNIVDEQLQTARIAVLLFRYKGNDTTLRSMVIPVHLMLTEWEDAE